MKQVSLAMKVEKYKITGMSCAACQANITRCVQKLAGVQDVDVSLLSNQMRVCYDEEKLQAAEIVEAVQGIGYGAAPLVQAETERGGFRSEWQQRQEQAEELAQFIDRTVTMAQTNAAAAALEVEGVSSLAANLGSDIAELLGKKNLAKGVRVKTEDDKVEVELSVLMGYGHTIPEIGKAIQEGVKSAIESMTGLEVSAVNVNVGGITFPPKE